MKKTILRAVLGVMCIAGFIALLGIAGRCDYEDAVICEMKNNGAYYELSHAHPHATDHELVVLYEKALSADDTCPD